MTWLRSRATSTPPSPGWLATRSAARRRARRAGGAAVVERPTQGYAFGRRRGVGRAVPPFGEEPGQRLVERGLNPQTASNGVVARTAAPAWATGRVDPLGGGVVGEPGSVLAGKAGRCLRGRRVGLDRQWGSPAASTLSRYGRSPLMSWTAPRRRARRSAGMRPGPQSGRRLAVAADTEEVRDRRQISPVVMLHDPSDPAHLPTVQEYRKFRAHTWRLITG